MIKHLCRLDVHLLAYQQHGWVEVHRLAYQQHSRVEVHRLLRLVIGALASFVSTRVSDEEQAVNFVAEFAGEAVEEGALGGGWSYRRFLGLGYWCGFMEGVSLSGS